MKCANPDCNRDIGLVAYRRGWLSKRRYCSKHCRDAFVPQKLQPKQGAVGLTSTMAFFCNRLRPARFEAEASRRRGARSTRRKWRN